MDKHQIEYISSLDLEKNQSSLEHYLRLEGNDMRELVKSMIDDGFRWWEPILIGSDDKIGDGHRRLKAALQVGIELVPTIKVLDKTSVELFKSRNNLRKRFDAYQWLRIYLIDNSFDGIPNKYQRDIKKLLVWGITPEELLNEFSQKGIGPGIVAYVERVLRFLEKDGILLDPKKITRWMNKHKMQFQARKSIDTGIHQTKHFVNCINNDVPLV